MNYFRCIGGNGGGGAPLTFSKTSVVDKSQFPNIAFNSDYTNYELLLFVYNDTSDNETIEFLATPDMLDSAFNLTQFMLNRATTNHYSRYIKSSNSLLSRNYSNYLEIVDVYSVTCNKNISFETIYQRADVSQSNVSIEYDGIFENDFVLVSLTGNGFVSIPNQYLNLLGAKEINTAFCYGFARYATGIQPSIIDNNSMTENQYFTVQGVKFT